MDRRRRNRMIGVGLAAALAFTPIVGDELLVLGATEMSETTSAQRDKRRTGENPNGSTPAYVGAIIIGMVVILAVQVIGLKGFVQH